MGVPYMMVTRSRAKTPYVTPHVFTLQSFTTYIDYYTLFLSFSTPKIWFKQNGDDEYCVKTGCAGKAVHDGSVRTMLMPKRRFGWL